MFFHLGVNLILRHFAQFNWGELPQSIIWRAKEYSALHIIPPKPNKQGIGISDLYYYFMKANLIMLALPATSILQKYIPPATVIP